MNTGVPDLDFKKPSSGQCLQILLGLYRHLGGLPAHSKAAGSTQMSRTAQTWTRWQLHRLIPNGEPKICRSHWTVLLFREEQKIVWLDIPKDNALRMTLSDKAQYGANDESHSLLCERALLDVVKDATPLTKLHHHMNVFWILEYVLWQH